MIAEGWSVLRFWNADALRERNAVINTIIAALERRLAPVEAPDLRFVATSTYREDFALADRVAPHPYPLPVKDGERESPTLASSSPRERGEGR